MTRIEELAPDAVAAAVSTAVVDAIAKGGDLDTVVARALDDAKRALGLGMVSAATPDNHPAPPPSRSGRAVVTEDDVIDAARTGRTELRIPVGALITPLARDTAKDRGVSLVEG